MVGGVFVFFGASRERSTERLTQIADWPKNRLQSYTNINGHWLDTSLDHIATVLQAPRVLVVVGNCARAILVFSVVLRRKVPARSHNCYTWQPGMRGTRNANLCHRNRGIE